jgi:hypothetical protein
VSRPRPRLVGDLVVVGDEAFTLAQWEEHAAPGRHWCRACQDHHDRVRPLPPPVRDAPGGATTAQDLVVARECYLRAERARKGLPAPPVGLLGRAMGLLYRRMTGARRQAAGTVGAGHVQSGRALFRPQRPPVHSQVAAAGVRHVD